MPDNNITEIATEFVDFVEQNKRKWQNYITYKDRGLNLIKATSFNASKINSGVLTGYYKDQSGEKTGERYTINPIFPFTVLNEEDGIHYTATGWLNAIFQLIEYNLNDIGKGRVCAIKMVAEEIERSIALKTIQLTKEGDCLDEHPRKILHQQYFINHTRDSDEIGYDPGIHKFCGGYIERKRSTEREDVLVCRNCYLRVYFPKKIKTYGELREFSKFSIGWKRRQEEIDPSGIIVK